ARDAQLVSQHPKQRHVVFDIHIVRRSVDPQAHGSSRMEIQFRHKPHFARSWRPKDAVAQYETAVAAQRPRLSAVRSFTSINRKDEYITIAVDDCRLQDLL